MKSPKNKTIDISVDEGRQYLDECLRLSEKIVLGELLDSTVCGDTLQAVRFMPHKFVDLLIADPPYNLDKNFGGENFRSMSDKDYAEYTEKWLTAIKPLLKSTATVYVCCDWKCSSIIEAQLKKHFHIRNRITWQREKGRGAARNYKNCMEDIWFATVSDKYTFNADAVKHRRRVIAPYKSDGEPKDWEYTENGKFRNTSCPNLWDDISVPYWSMAENTAHPTQKPEKLLAKLILASSNEGDVVFDPFLGSGSSSVTAKKLNRHYVGVEKSEQYCVWAQKRLQMADVDKSIQGYDDGVFWERNSGIKRRK